MRIKVATHNMHDDARASRLGDLIGWTEVNRNAVRGLDGMKHWTGRRAPKGLAVSWDPKKFRKSWVNPVQAHGGVAKLSPDRGFIVLRGRLANGRKCVFVVTHLVNNAFGPVKRGGRATRVRLWFTAVNRLKRKIKRWERRGIAVIVVGDFNRKEFDFLPPLEDTRDNGDRPTYDRIFVSDDIKIVKDARSGPRNGSDHRSEIAALRIWRR